jgi:uncharacterized protein (TIGR00369 family)
VLGARRDFNAARARSGVDLSADYAALASGKKRQPYDVAMGFRIVTASPEGHVLEADVDARFANPTGVLHGGVIMGLADSAMGLTVTGLTPRGHWGTNTDLHIRFLRPVFSGTIRAESRIVRKGRRVVVMECDVKGPDGKVAAKATSNFLILEGTPDRA